MVLTGAVGMTAVAAVVPAQVRLELSKGEAFFTILTHLAMNDLGDTCRDTRWRTS